MNPGRKRSSFQDSNFGLVFLSCILACFFGHPVLAKSTPTDLARRAILELEDKSFTVIQTEGNGHFKKNRKSIMVSLIKGETYVFVVSGDTTVHETTAFLFSNNLVKLKVKQLQKGQTCVIKFKATYSGKHVIFMKANKPDAEYQYYLLSATQKWMIDGRKKKK